MPGPPSNGGVGCVLGQVVGAVVGPVVGAVVGPVVGLVDGPVVGAVEGPAGAFGGGPAGPGGTALLTGLGGAGVAGAGLLPDSDAMKHGIATTDAAAKNAGNARARPLKDSLDITAPIRE